MSLCHKLEFSNPYTLQPDGVNFQYFKLKLFDQTKFIVWNILGIWLWVAKIVGFENQRFLSSKLFYENMVLLNSELPCFCSSKLIDSLENCRWKNGDNNNAS